MFEETLKELVHGMDGATGAAVLSLDGVVIEAVDGAGAVCAPDDVTTEYALVLRQLLGVAEEVELGSVQTFTVKGQARLGVVRVLSPQYVVAMNVSPDAIPGKAHFQLRVAAPDLAREL